MVFMVLLCKRTRCKCPFGLEKITKPILRNRASTVFAKKYAGAVTGDATRNLPQPKRVICMLVPHNSVQISPSVRPKPFEEHQHFPQQC